MTTRIRLTKHQQLTLCHKYDERSDWTLNELARWAAQEFSLPKCPGKSSIRRILQTKKQLSSLSADCLSRKELRSPFLLQLDQAIAEFVVNAELAKMPISGAVVLAMVKRVVGKLQVPAAHRPLFTRAGWLRHFLARYGFRRKRAHGEIASVDVVAARRQLQRLREQVGQFHPSDVYNMDETAVFFSFHVAHLYRPPRSPRKKARQVPHHHGRCRQRRWIGQPSSRLPRQGSDASLAARQARFCAVRGDVEGLDDGGGVSRVASAPKRENEADRHILLLVDNAPVHIDRDLQLSSMKVQKLPPHDRATPTNGPRCNRMPETQLRDAENGGSSGSLSRRNRGPVQSVVAGRHRVVR